MELNKDLQDSNCPENSRGTTEIRRSVAYLHQIRLELRCQLELAKLWKIYELERDLARCISQMGQNGSPWTRRRSLPCKSAPLPRPGNGKRSACALSVATSTCAAVESSSSRPFRT